MDKTELGRGGYRTEGKEGSRREGEKSLKRESGGEAEKKGKRA